MNVEFKCPQCGNAVSADELYRGQVVECPHCTKGIVVPKSKANGGGLRRLAKVVNIKCPHCGTEYEVTQRDMHHHVSCEICGKDFVIGETPRTQSAGAMSVTSQTNQNPNPRTPATGDNAPPESCTRKTKRTIWIAACAACMVLLLTAVFILGRYSGKPNTPANVAPTIGSDTSDKPKGGEAVVSVGNETSVKTPEEATSETSADKPPETTNEEVAATTKDETAIPVKPSSSPAEAVAMVEGNDGVKQEKNENDSAVHTSNEAIVKAPAEPTVEANSDVEANADTVSGTEQEEVADATNETEAPVKPSLEMSSGRTLEAESVAPFGETKLKGKNPLELFHFGDAPRNNLSENNTVEYEISDFLGFQQMILGYTKQGHLFSICLVSENDHCSATESDARVTKIMQLCDEWIDGIEWDVQEQEHDGRKFAIGRINNTHIDKIVHNKEKDRVVEIRGRTSFRKGIDVVKQYNYVDRVFSIVPTRGERNVVGLQVNFVGNRLRRLETDYLTLDIRRPLKVTDALYKGARLWFKEQNRFDESVSERYYDGNHRYAYSLTLDRTADYEGHRQAFIRIEDGVLKVSGTLPIAESYAEKLITAKIIVMNRKFEGIEGEIYDNRPCGPGGHVTLPCPICKGDKSKQKGECKCWSKSRNMNRGKIDIEGRNFKEGFEAYKKAYRNGTWSWRPIKQPPKEQTESGRRHEPRSRPSRIRPSRTRKNSSGLSLGGSGSLKLGK